MDDATKIINTATSVPEEVSTDNLIKTEDKLVDELGKGKGRKYVRFVMAALGSIPWVGSYLSILGAIASLSAEFDQDKVNNMHKLWLEEHRSKLEELGRTLDEIFSRLDGFGEEIQQRIESPEYLTLVRKAFTSWDNADTEEKRQMVKRLIMNAGASTLCTDDLVRLFIKWIDEYHESHFSVIKEIYQNPQVTRGQIWDKSHTERPREDSAEADLFRYLIRDLNIGGVIRQERETTEGGEFVRHRATSYNRSTGVKVMESAFEDTKPYVLTELGKEFVHYVLNDVVTRIEGQQ